MLIPGMNNWENESSDSKKCGCSSTYYYYPISCVTNDDNCPFTVKSDCVIYNGPDLPNTDVKTKDTLTLILEKVDVAVGVNSTSGTSGTSGHNGTSGVNGTSGTGGTSGVSGTSGTTGSSGVTGTSGTSGNTGTSGTTGTSGINGTSGVNGNNGTSGTSGNSGTSGAAGSSGTSGTSPGGLLLTTINIGDWNMVSSSSINVSTGLDITKIRMVDIIIRNDSDGLYTPLIAYGGTTSYYSLNVSTGNITLQRTTGGTYDSTNYDSTSYNRGYITIWYTP